MPEFLKLLPPDDARQLLLAALPVPEPGSEVLDTLQALGRVTAEDLVAPHSLPEFPRSTVDGYAVRAADTFGASDSLPAYLSQVGEVPMGGTPDFSLEKGQCGLIHTGGMLPSGADGVVMLEYTQASREAEIEIMRAVADGENVIQIGEDVARGQVVIPKGRIMRPAEVGGLMALGITKLRVVNKVRVGLISSGDEVVPPEKRPAPGQVRDINSYTLAALVTKAGGQPVTFGIVSDKFEALQSAAVKALAECDLLVITAGSSASTRDMTADVIASLGKPGVLVHGVNTRPGKPTILGVCDGKAVIGLPGNPVSALVNGFLFVAPLIERLLGALPRPQATLQATLTVNLASQAGREDWWPVKLVPTASNQGEAGETGSWRAEPIFGKSNLIFTLAAADGMLRIAPDATGLGAGELVEVVLI
jgi:molybdopterin molybdotransferase